YATDDDFAMEFTAAFDSNNGFLLDPNTGSSVFEVALSGNGGTCVTTFTRPSAAAWHNYVCLFDLSKASNEVDSVYVDGSTVSLTYLTNNNNTNNWPNSTLNFMSRNNASNFGAGRMAEVAIWGGVLLDAAEAVALGKGVSPLLVRPTALQYYWPLGGRFSPEIDVRQGKSAT